MSDLAMASKKDEIDLDVNFIHHNWEPLSTRKELLREQGEDLAFLL